jgi:hypothetical protein
MRRREFLGVVGGAAAWPRVARAQGMPVVGWISSRAASEARALLATLEGLGDLQGLTDVERFVLPSVAQMSD